MVRHVPSLLLAAFALSACAGDVEPPPPPEMPAQEPAAVTPPLPPQPEYAGQLMARGNEPFWAVELRGDEAILRTPDHLDGVIFSAPEWESLGSGHWRLSVERPHADGVEFLTLEIREEPCQDTMSGERFPFASSVRYGELTGPGCAEPNQ